MTVHTVEKNNSYHFVALDKFDYTLEDYMHNHDQSMDILRGIVRGVFCLHGKSIAHGELKASNVLIRRGDHPKYIAKLGGMGRSKRLTEGDRRLDLYDLALMLLRCVSFKDDPTEKNQEDQKKEFDNKLKTICY
ncbi:serine/threonine-protein kinase HT1 [Tanacetum coccineum]